MSSSPLMLHEEIILLILKDREGTFRGSWIAIALGAALLAELLLGGHATTAGDSKDRPLVRAGSRPADPLLAECHALLSASKKERTSEHWVTKFAGSKDLAHRVAECLVDRGILRADRKTMMLFFEKRIYPEIDHRPESELLDRMRNAIEGSGDVDARTAVVTALAFRTDLLRYGFDSAFIKTHKARIEAICDGHAVVRGAQEAVEAAMAVIMVIVILPTIMTTIARP